MRTPKIAPQTYDPKFMQFLVDDVNQLNSPISFSIKTITVKNSSPFTLTEPGLSGAVVIKSTEHYESCTIKPGKNSNTLEISVVAPSNITFWFLLIKQN